MVEVLNWLNGWRYDLDGWIVRARYANDPHSLPADIGFVEEACIAVRTPEDARCLDLACNSRRATGGE